MKRQIDREDAAVLTVEEPDAAFDAWTLEDLDGLTDLGSVRWASSGSDDAG